MTITNTTGGNVTTKKPSALEFALLIDTHPDLTEDVVTNAFRAATAGWAARDDVQVARAEAPLAHGLVKVRDEIGDFTDDELSRHLGLPVEDRRIVKPIQKADTAALALAASRFVAFADRLPNLNTWHDRQAVWNLVGGRRSTPTPVTNCAAAYAARRAEA